MYATAEGADKWKNAWAQILQDDADVLRDARGVYGIFVYYNADDVPAQGNDGFDELLGNELVRDIRAAITDATFECTFVRDEKLGDRVMMTLFVVKQELGD